MFENNDGRNIHQYQQYSNMRDGILHTCGR